ncbi:DNA-directed RNA polymerase subunit beta'' [Castilleja foliolosa]|uniref:Photosystem I assembly protein Ycf4 n=1 Tax=Castilleja foliolosa TaxID=1961234 RepID=A0ABD3E1P6_9LAMI
MSWRSEHIWIELITGSRKLSNFCWALIVFLGSLGFLLVGTSSYLGKNLISFVPPQQIIGGISDTNIQLVRTCLVLNWDQDKKSSSSQEARASFVEIRANGLIRHFLRIDLVKSIISYIGKRNDPSGSGLLSGLLSDNGSDCTNINPFSSIYSKVRIQQPLNQNQRTIHTLLNRNTGFQSLIILSSSNCFRMGPFNDGKYHNVIKESIKITKDPLIPINNLLGPLGTAFLIANVSKFGFL